MASEIPQQRQETIQRYLETWAAAFAEALQQVAAPGCRAIALDDEVELTQAFHKAREGLAVRFDCAGGLTGGQRLAVSVPDAIVLGRLLIGESGDVPAELPEAERDAAIELLRQVAGLAAGRLKELVGKEVRFDEREPEEWKPVSTKTIRLEGVGAGPVQIVFEVEEALSTAIEMAHKASAETSPANDAGRLVGNAAPETANLPLLLDIELEASIRFGQKELLLKDVLNLRPGTVVEMARRVNEPAELLVAGKLMARGEVVVVEGNYGLRVTEILGPAERMAVLQG